MVWRCSWDGVSCKKQTTKPKKWLLSSRSRWGFVWYNMVVSTTSSEVMILLEPNAVWWQIVISQSVMQKYWFDVFTVKATVKVQSAFNEYKIVIVCVYYLCLSKQGFWTAEPFLIKLVWWCIIISWRSASIFSLPLISLQPNWVCWSTITRPHASTVGISDSSTVTYSI